MVVEPIQIGNDFFFDKSDAGNCAKQFLVSTIYPKQFVKLLIAIKV